MTFAPLVVCCPPPPDVEALPPPPPLLPPHAATTRAQASATTAATTPKRPLMRPLLQGPTLNRCNRFQEQKHQPGTGLANWHFVCTLSRVGGCPPFRLGRDGGAGRGPSADSHHPGRGASRRGERGDGLARPQRRPRGAQRGARSRAPVDRRARVPPEL